MGLLTKPIETARKNRDSALAEAEQWATKAATVRAEADSLDATANAAILEDESAAERITVQVTTLNRKASAYEQAARETRGKAESAGLDVLRIEADELDKAAAKVRQALDKHNAEVAKAKNALEEIAGHGFIPGENEPDGETTYVTGEARPSRSYRVGKAAPLREQALHLTTQAQVIRYWLEDRQLPRTLNDLNTKFGATHSAHFLIAGSDSLDRYGDPITESLRAAVDAGLAAN